MFVKHGVPSFTYSAQQSRWQPRVAMTSQGCGHAEQQGGHGNNGHVVAVNSHTRCTLKPQHYQRTSQKEGATSARD
jgi:hypothetical protein